MVFPSNRAASGHLGSIDRLFREARRQAGLPKEFVLYCARHECGTRVLMRTGNLAAVLKTMGHRDVKSAKHYQHRKLDVVRAALEFGAALGVRRRNLPVSFVVRPSTSNRRTCRWRGVNSLSRLLLVSRTNRSSGC
jgi:Phage integrase family